MKPILLQIQALGPFSNSESVDFTTLGNNPLFLINGPTGSGKTTILDAICFALYGESTGKDRKIDQMISDYADETLHTEVNFTFFVKDKKYKIKRIPKQEKIKVNKTGTTERKAEAILYTYDKNDKETIYSNKIIDVNSKIIEVIGLGVDQFRQVIVLPQGKFRELLTAESKEREAIFSQLFQTQIYKSIEVKLKNKAQEIKERINSYLDKIEGLLKTFNHESIYSLETELNSILDSYDTLTDEKDKSYQLFMDANDSYKEGLRLTSRFNLLESKRIEMNNLKSLEAEILNSKIVVQNYEKAIKIKGDFDKLINIKSDIHNVEDRILKVSEEVKALVYLNKESEEKLNICKDNQNKIQDYLQEKSKLEEKRNSLDFIQNLNKNLDQEKRRELDIKIVKSKYSEDIQEIIQKIAEIENEFIYNQNEISKIESFNYSLKNIQHSIEIKNKKIILQNEFSIFEEKEKSLSKKLEDLQSEESEIKNNLNKSELQYHLNQAVLLAQTLKEDLPCPVCGSTSHPSIRVKLNNEETISNTDLTNLRENSSTIKEKIFKIKSELESTNFLKLKNREESIIVFQQDIEFENESIESLQEMSSELQRKIQNLIILKNKQPEFNSKIINFKSELESISNKEESINNELKSIENKILIIKSQIELKNSESNLTNLDIDIINKEIKLINSTVETIRNELKVTEINFNNNQSKLIQTEAFLTSLENQKSELVHNLNKSEIIWKNSRLTEGFKDDKEFQEIIKLEKFIPSYKDKIIEYQTSYDTINSIINEIADELKSKEKPDTLILENNKKNYQINFEKLNSEWMKSTERKNNLNNVTLQFNKYKEATIVLENEYSIYGKLSEIASGKNENVNLQRFVLSVLLEDVLSQGSLRLQIMSKGRYKLTRKEDKSGGNKASGLDLEVYDEYTGYKRHVSTLSGGESFLAALSLALGLSDVIQSYAGGIKLDTIFIDEGFGSLDQESLELAIRALTDLQNSGRTIGIISHVTELKEQIKIQIDIQNTKTGSTIKIKNSFKY